MVALEGSLLKTCSGVLAGRVNSSHHQAVDRLGDGLRATARSDDGVIEAVERIGGGAFFLLVQWHPERMAAAEHAFSGSIKESFLSSLKQHARGANTVDKGT